ALMHKEMVRLRNRCSSIAFREKDNRIKVSRTRSLRAVSCINVSGNNGFDAEAVHLPAFFPAASDE
ncbi:hypothetical protein CCACVL1_09120, partial [Corchorus capsularis]